MQTVTNGTDIGSQKQVLKFFHGWAYDTPEQFVNCINLLTGKMAAGG